MSQFSFLLRNEGYEKRSQAVTLLEGQRLEPWVDGLLIGRREVLLQRREALQNCISIHVKEFSLRIVQGGNQGAKLFVNLAFLRLQEVIRRSEHFQAVSRWRFEHCWFSLHVILLLLREDPIQIQRLVVAAHCFRGCTREPRERLV